MRKVNSTVQQYLIINTKRHQSWCDRRTSHQIVTHFSLHLCGVCQQYIWFDLSLWWHALFDCQQKDTHKRDKVKHSCVFKVTPIFTLSLNLYTSSVILVMHLCVVVYTLILARKALPKSIIFIQ